MLTEGAPGGLSLVSDQDFLSASLAPDLFSNTGLGDLTLPELNDFLTGHQAEAEVQFENDGVFVSGSAVPGDLPVLFQLLNKRLSVPRRDPGAESSFLAQTAVAVKNHQDLPQQAFQNETTRLLTNGAARTRPLTTERLGEVVPDRAARLYTDIVAGGSGFTFTITGDFDEQTLKPLVETYLATLPGGKSQAIKDLGIRPASGPAASVVKKGQDRKAVVSLSIPVDAPYSLEGLFAAQTLKEVLDIRLREVVRQDKEGTYGVGVGVGMSPSPYPHAVTQVRFTCAPDRQDELLKAVTDELKAVAAGNISDEVFAKALEIRKRTVETNQKNNSWWCDSVSEALFNGDDLKLLANEALWYQGLKKETVVAMAKALVDPAKALTVVLDPAN